jgi:hypothetical protein
VLAGGVVVGRIYKAKAALGSGSGLPAASVGRWCLQLVLRPATLGALQWLRRAVLGRLQRLLLLRSTAIGGWLPLLLRPTVLSGWLLLLLWPSALSPWLLWIWSPTLQSWLRLVSLRLLLFAACWSLTPGSWLVGGIDFTLFLFANRGQVGNVWFGHGQRHLFARRDHIELSRK